MHFRTANSASGRNWRQPHFGRQEILPDSESLPAIFQVQLRRWDREGSSKQAMPDTAMGEIDYRALLEIAMGEARKGLAEGGIPIGAALFDGRGKLLGRGHNRRVQENDPSIHAETDAFRKAGRQRGYADTIMVTTLAPCWYCSGLVRQFGIRTVVVGESQNFRGGIDWLRADGVNVVDLTDPECVHMLGDFIRANPALWNEDIGER